ncbi:putative TRAM/LAG1/CLN8 domain-containing protein [Plasmopara halstedii]
MGWYDGGDMLLEEEHQVRVGENALVTSIAFALFWANFGVSWYISNRRVPEFSGFTTAQKADWCSRVNSTIHAVVIVVGVTYALADIRWSSDYMPMSSIRAASFVFSIGYFLCDLIIIIVWPVPMQLVFIIHHTVAVVPYFINNFISCCAACQFGLLVFLLVELATLPLNLRGFLDARDRQESKHYLSSVYTTYVIWGISRTALPIFLMYVFWAYVYPSDRNHDTCFFPSFISAHLIALFCIGVFVFVHTPEVIRFIREHRKAREAIESSEEVNMNTDDADLVESGIDELPSTKDHRPSSIRSLTLSLTRSKEPVTDDSYDNIELGVMPRSARARATA